MTNDGTYFLSTPMGKVYPDEVFPFTHEGYEWFAHLIYNYCGEWGDWYTVTQKRLGLYIKLTCAPTPELSRMLAEQRISEIIQEIGQKEFDKRMKGGK